jgi:hypothetical protein
MYEDSGKNNVIMNSNNVFYTQVEKLPGAEHSTWAPSATMHTPTPVAQKRCNMPFRTVAVSVVIRALSSCRVFTLWLYIWSFIQPQRKTSSGVRQDATQLIYLFLSIDGGNSRSVTDSVSKMNSCPIQLKKCMIIVAVELQKNIIW